MMARKRLPQFDAPPVNEVVFGVRFDPISNLRMAHIGLFWSRIKKEFGKCDQQPPIASTVPPTDERTNLILPRTWFIHNEENYLIQIQPNIFFLNWRRIRNSDPYPHYKKIRPQFEKRLNQYFRFLDDQDLQRPQLHGYELTYVNLIPMGHGWKSLDQISNVLPDLNWRNDASRFLPSPKGIGWQALFGLPNDAGDLLVQLQTATSRERERPILRLEVSARYVAQGKAPITLMEWFDIAHEWIVEGFADLTSQQVQRKHWKRLDGARRGN